MAANWGRWAAACLVLLLVELCAIPVNGETEAEDGKWIMIVTTHHKGHLNPLNALAKELASRNTAASPLRVSIATFDVQEAQHRVVPEADFVSCGSLPHSLEEDERLTGELFDMDDMFEMMKASMDLFEIYESLMSKNLVKYFAEHGTPDYLVVDAIANGGFDAADALSLPLVVVQTTGLPIMDYRSSFYLPFAAWQPVIMSPLVSEEMGILDRWGGYLMLQSFELMSKFILFPFRNELRAEVGAPPLAAAFRVDEKPRPLILAAAFGFDFAVSLPPYIFPVGAMIDPSTAAIREMPEDVQEWLDASDVPVIFVSTGTNVVLTETKMTEFLAVFTSPDFHFRVLWSLKEVSYQFLPAELPDHIFVKTFFPQMRVLAHDNVKLFVSHCGANSVLESIENQVPILAVPYIGDQPVYAGRLKAAGMAEILDKDNIRPDTFIAAANKALHPSYPAAARRLKSALDLAGGKERAADVVLYLAEHGHEQLIPYELQLPWYLVYHLDIYGPLLVVGLLILVVPFYTLRCLFRCCAGGKEKSE